MNKVLLTMLITEKKSEPALPAEMSSQQKVWLRRVADLLDSTPDHLLASAMIDSHDLVELISVNPQAIANIIRITWPRDIYQPS